MAKNHVSQAKIFLHENTPKILANNRREDRKSRGCDFRKPKFGVRVRVITLNRHATVRVICEEFGDLAVGLSFVMCLEDGLRFSGRLGKRKAKSAG